MDDWTSAQWADECARMKQTIEALEAAERAGTPKEHLIVLAHEAGVGEIFRNTMNRSERT
jgi:erythromycin esterase-like protein